MKLNSRFAVLALLVAFTAPLGAQNAAPANAAPDSSRIPLRIAPTGTDSAAQRSSAPQQVDRRAAAHYNRSAQPAAPMAFAAGQTQPVALMIVGGAALLAGALIEGDAGRVFMVGGAVVGLIGLYQYLQ